MKKTILALGVIATFVGASVFMTSTGCGSGKPDSDTLKGDSPVVAGIPNAYAMQPVDMRAQTQESADTFSWMSFIAMNWPANASTCGPDTTKNILTGGGPVVWETYLADDQIYVDTNKRPAAWCNQNANAVLENLPASVQELSRKTGITRFIHTNAKIDSMAGIDEAFGGPLVDQNGRFVRYEVRVNADEYNYITTNTLWNKKGQAAFTKDSTISFPVGQTKYGSVGAMEIKAAWKVLGANDDTSSFYTIEAIVYNDNGGKVSPGANPVMLGLVGLHIAHKTPTQKNWVWSTFEHQDNLTKSFFNPACDTCKPNQPIPGTNIVELNPQGLPIHSPTQVTRVNPLDDPYLDGINTYFQGMLKGSVWANYELIGTQWFQFEAVATSYLANSVLETYLQGPSPASYGTYPLRQGEVYFTDPRYQPFSSNSSSSCMGCHFKAHSNAKPSFKYDFSFLMGEAK
ncbi:MAG TPA: hypothetical protein VK826_08210 [Bacteroidia bacterium]|nr:hypothetical protein [Bacteroidia bacterium]